MNRYENYYDSEGNYLEDINHDDDQFLSPLPKSFGFISPGDVLCFNYPRKGQVFVLVARVKRGPGLFYTKNGNLLLACFKLTTTSAKISSTVIKMLYKNRRFADYANLLRGLEVILGTGSFRTYRMDRISNLYSVSIDEQRLPSIDDTDSEVEE